jgi:hypothetical protein
MSSLVAAYTFNESAAHDFSGNKYDMTNTGVTYALTTSNAWGCDAVFTSGSNNLDNELLYSFSGFAGFTCFMNVYPTLLNKTICFVTGTFSISLNSSGNVVFVVTDNVTTTHMLTSTAAITASTWNTIACVWDGAFLYVYINGALDSTLSVSFSYLNSSDYGFQIGGSGFTGLLNMIEIRNLAMSAAQIQTLNSSPGGNLMTVDIHQFSVGDLIADPDVAIQGVVTWVVDQANFVYYPLNGSYFHSVSQYGNVYNTARQNKMEILNNFDGNGSSQIRVIFPITCFADYFSPANKITFDHNGLSSTANLANMMAITSLRI